MRTIFLVCAFAACSRNNPEFSQMVPGESCGTPMSCFAGRYALCTHDGQCRYLTTDGKSFDCASCSDCFVAEVSVKTWCGGGTTGGGTTGGGTTGGTTGGGTTGGGTTGGTTGGGTTGGGTTGGTTGGSGLDPNLSPASGTGAICTTPGSLTQCGVGQACRFYTSTQARCDAGGPRLLGDSCTASSDCDILFVCYAGHCRNVCHIGTSECGAPANCIDVGFKNAAIGVCLN
jgi:hypothetical protein